MTLDHTIRNAIGKTLAAGTALYVGICGLPGLAGKEDVQVSQQPPAAEQQVQGSYLERAANELFVQNTAMAEDTTSQPSIVEMYDWDGVCTKKSEYNSNIPSSNRLCWSANGENFLDAINNDEAVYRVMQKHDLLEPLKEIQESETNYLDSVRITNNYIDLVIHSTIDNHSDMNIKGDSRYFVSERLGTDDIDTLRPYFQ